MSGGIRTAIAAVKAAFPDAELVEIRDIEPIEPIPWCQAFDNELAKVREEGDRMRYYCELRWIALELGRQDGWAAVAYKERFGAWPPWGWKDLGLALPPRESTRRRVRIRDRKSREEWKRKKEQERAREQQTETAERGSGEEPEWPDQNPW